MAAFELIARKRSDKGKGAARKLRAAGQVPAVMYGLGNEPRKLTVPKKEIEKYLKGEGGTTLVHLNVEDSGDSAYVIIKDYQLDPVHDNVVHLDFQEVDLTKKTVVSVPFEFVGTPAGVEMGGIMEVINRDIEISCLPTEIPSSIPVDVSSLDLGDVLHLKDIPLPDGLEPTVSDLNVPLVSVYEMAEEVVEEVEEEEVEEVAEGEEAPEDSGEDTETD